MEGSAAQYLWMIPFNERGLFEALGGIEAANKRLDRFFHNPDGSWAVTESGGYHAELNNEPSIETPWLYDFSGQPWKTQETVRQVLKTIWTNTPSGMPGNDDLGEMSSWFVWSAMGMYPEIPGRAELVLGSPLFEEVWVRRPGRDAKSGAGQGPRADILIRAKGANANTPYVQGVKVNGKKSSQTYLTSEFVKRGGKVEFELSATPNKAWGTGTGDAPPSFGAEEN